MPQKTFLVIKMAWIINTRRIPDIKACIKLNFMVKFWNVSKWKSHNKKNKSLSELQSIWGSDDISLTWTSVLTPYSHTARPRRLSCGPVAKTSPQTDNRALPLIWHKCRLPVRFLLYPPQEGSEALLLRWGALWVFLYEFLSRTMGQFWILRAPYVGGRVSGGSWGEFLASLDKQMP